MSQFGFSLLPGYTERHRRSRLIRRNSDRYLTDKTIVIDSAQTDANAPASSSEILSGNVVVFSTSLANGTFVLTSDTTDADVNAPASVTSTIAIATWNTKTLIISYKGGPAITVTGTTADTCDQAVIDCNGNVAFAACFVADKVATNKLRIRTLDAGADVYFTLGAGTENDVGGAAATFTAGSYAGTDADYRIMVDSCVLLDAAGAAAAAPVLAADAGEFITANLFGLTAQAEQVLRRKGCKFYAGAPGGAD